MRQKTRLPGRREGVVDSPFGIKVGASVIPGEATRSIYKKRNAEAARGALYSARLNLAGEPIYFEAIRSMMDNSTGPSASYQAFSTTLPRAITLVSDHIALCKALGFATYLAMMIWITLTFYLIRSYSNHFFEPKRAGLSYIGFYGANSFRII